MGITSRLAAACIAVLVAACSAPVPPSRAPAASATPSPTAQGSASPPLEEDEGVDQRIPDTSLQRKLELYPGKVSVAPGERLPIKVSTPAARYRLEFLRQGWYEGRGEKLVATLGPFRGEDQRSRVAVDPVTHLVRANWKTSVEVDTSGWAPGVYMIRGLDGRGSIGYAPLVVRSPTIDRSAPLFVFTALTYEAYNSWGGFSLYTRPRAMRVGFDRPSDLVDGRGTFDRSDGRLLRWLDRVGVSLQYTTDYDLSVSPPAVVPPLLVVPMHMEYVPATLRDWLEEHVNLIGDMNLALFGANSVYWQVRLEPGVDPQAPFDVVCYKGSRDPMAAIDSALTTVRWRDPPVARPEGTLFGAQYAGILGNGRTSRYDYVVDANMPTGLLAGTGWFPGERIRGLLVGEGDALYQGADAISLMNGLGENKRFRPMRTNVVIRTSPAGARVFAVGSFQWTDGFDPVVFGLDLGVSSASFDRFNRNVLAWLGVALSG